MNKPLAGSSPACTVIEDVQNRPDTRHIAIDKVGIKNLRYPIKVLDRTNGYQHTVASINMYVDLPHRNKGTHMSRFVEVLNSHGRVLDVRSMAAVPRELLERLDAGRAHVEFRFPYFRSKQAPVTGKESLIDCKVCFEVEADADGEIDFAFSYHQAEASRQILDGLFPETVRTYVFDEGTIANTHFVAIPFNAADSAGAMVVANFLLSPEAQLKKAAPDVWGDFPIIDPARLPAEWRKRFDARPLGAATLSDTELQSHQLPEPPSEILIQLEKGWQQHVLKGR